MIVAGLTGSIAMGKSTVAQMFAALGAPVFDADAAVREFYRTPEAGAVEAAFPGVAVGGEIDRTRLAEAALADPEALKRLEAIVHPEVARRRIAFLKAATSAGRRLALVDVPLLFETGGEKSVDLVVVVSASAAIQRARALKRPGMNEAKFEAILARQTPDAEKRRRAHFIIDTSGELAATRAQVASLMRALAAAPGHGGHDA
ncbi:MAG: dephospho-CoA kinase [Bradyrhizobium sp.]|nr:MAG: dephospho-CoA kinase [Bradyrhizobium sp.]